MLVAKKEFYDYSQSNKEEVKIKKKRVIKKNKNNVKVKLKVFTYTVIVLMSAISLLGRYAYIAQFRTEINTYDRQIQSLAKEKEALEVSLYEISQSEWVENEAREKLGMTYPTSDQTVLINVGEALKSNKEDSVDKDKSAFLSSIKGVINKVINVF